MLISAELLKAAQEEACRAEAEVGLVLVYHDGSTEVIDEQRLDQYEDAPACGWAAFEVKYNAWLAIQIAVWADADELSPMLSAIADAWVDEASHWYGRAEFLLGERAYWKCADVLMDEEAVSIAAKAIDRRDTFVKSWLADNADQQLIRALFKDRWCTNVVRLFEAIEAKVS